VITWFVDDFKGCFKRLGSAAGVMALLAVLRRVKVTLNVA
jgi:hypothetical protein